MRFFAVVAALVSAAAAETFTVVVGGNTSLTYNPTSLTAAAGDTIQFQFVSKNHTVTQSTFAAPCTAMAGGVDSGYQAVAANATDFPVWSFTLTNASAPLWFFCEQVGHCGKGMVFAVNPTAAKSFDAFQAAALATASNTTSSSGTSASASGSKASGSATGTSGAAGASGSATTGNGAFSSRSTNVAGLVSVLGLVAGLLL